ncbi:polyketide synthase [Flavobacterium sp. 245]|uniref:polyketide synthase n=1 Tax=Flavobacterium sp. 245 TaxID=2512115 RepID=UPI0010DD9419|nr:polyketide synthase [Flavobacterium sp. 245]TDO97047.1 amino acid adenylation domain-containing protein [Flavobacterium sp. 245]
MIRPNNNNTHNKMRDTKNSHPINTLYELFAKQVEMHPNSIALEFDKKQVTYSELEQAASKAHLSLLKQAKNENIIGLSTTRGVEQIIFMLAILKAGKAYLPIDFGYPKSRILNIIKNSNLTFCLSNDTDEATVLSLGLKSLKNNDIQNQTDCNQDAMSQNAAYILYTSGSTGEPKGVCMGQGALINLINWQNKKSTSTNGTRTLQFAPLTFDVSFQEIMATLSTGGTLVLIEEYLRLDMVALINFIEKQQINRLFLPFVALQALAEAAFSADLFPNSLKEIMTAGEQLKITPVVQAFFTKLNTCVLYNQYGPTECHVVTELKLDGDPAYWPTLPSIGKPIYNTSILILNQNLEIVDNGEIGELYIAGECLAEGYLKNEQLTNEKFLDWKAPDGKNIRIYRSGDIAKYLPDGNIEFLGRQDDQVKISGHRIELAEVELAINSLIGIQQTVVLASNLLGQTQLAAYIQTSQENIDIAAIREKTATILPDYMIPSYFTLVKEFPRTSSGKIDKKMLPPPEYNRPSNAPLYKKATTEIQKNITKAWFGLFHIPKIGIDDNFFEMGGTSLLAQKLVAVLLKEYNYKLPVTKLYQFPTISQIAEYLEPKKDTEAKNNIKKDTKLNGSADVAIIGMAGRFPGANTIDQLWEVLKEGKETISFFKPEELDPSIPESLRNDPLYVSARGILPNSKTFDAAFFGINSKLAEVMDPQQRIFLEIAWESLEQTGYLPKHYKGTIGVYAGTGANTYYKKNILPNTEIIDQIGYLQAETVNEKDYISTRTAYHLNLKGPAVSVHSACSTSLLAIAEAVEAIRNGQCDIALAGGSSITAPIFSGHLYQEGSMLSPDGHCRSFDALGKGTVFSDGAGVVLLKSLDTAQKDGDKIYGIIKGIGVTNDGGSKGSFTAPSVEGQALAITKAIQDARVSPNSISYVETHGTATPLGDPIEIEGLKMAFGEQDINNFCALGSIKSNMGHLTAAAGVAGLIKTILAMNNKVIPPSLGFNKPNPAINFEDSPFFVNASLRNWNSNEPLRAGVSSFGVGGTNVHIVVEEYPTEQKKSSPSRPLQLLMWSSKSEKSAKGYETELGNFLQSKPDLSLADVAFSLNKTRETFAYRSFLLSESNTDASRELLSDQKNNIKNAVLKIAPGELVFLFPGQGSQFSQMGINLYKNEPVYKDAIDKCATILLDELSLDIREILYPEIVTPETETRLKETRFTQPALFVTEYALSQLWLSWGIKPTVYCGHSIGEFVVAHLAGIFSLEDALHLIAVRGRLVNELPAGSMLSVRLHEDKLKELLPKTLSLAAINSDFLCVVAGKDSHIKEFAKSLDAIEIANNLLFTSHAFHSSMMDPVLEVFENEVKKARLNKPTMPIVSTVTGSWLKDEEAVSSKYWSDHLRSTVRFAPAADVLLKLEDPIFIEIGPGHTLTTLTKQQATGKIIPAFTSLAAPKNKMNEYNSVLQTLGELWQKGIDPDWNAFYSGQDRQKVELPSYVFDRKRCWIDPPLVQMQNSIPVSVAINAKNTDIIQNSISKLNGNKPMRKTTILNNISSIVSQTSGIDYPNDASSQSFLDLGMDSLTLTQLAIRLKKDFKIAITFRQLNEEFSSPSLLADYLDLNLPQEEYKSIEPTKIVSNVIAAPTATANLASPTFNNTSNTALGLIAQQLQLLGKQMELLQGNTAVESNEMHQETFQQSETDIKIGNTVEEVRTPEEISEHQKPFGASPRIEKQTKEMSTSQKEFLNELIATYTAKTGKSKSYAQKNRSFMADPRVVSGFKPLTKEIVYPIVIEKSSGNRLWDLDGNVYIDTLNGFGSCFFGYQPDFIKEVLHQQIEDGFEVGPQHPLAGEVCELLCEFTKQDRAALCNTGSEAVLGAIRIARTVTGRSLIVAFSGSYHGIIDEVLVRGSKKLISFPAAPGIMPESVQNILILEYGTEESLRIIRERADELAAVLVEPVQSRRPEFQPIAFLNKLRELTAETDVPLIFDEVITGFRMHPGGIQALFNIQADIATYGKVIGGGLSIGAIAGKRKYMDALDGGHWQYGDDSIPEIGVTYFAGTFVRHPLALAASKAVLTHLKKQGPDLQERLNNMTSRLAAALNTEIKAKELPMTINHFGSLWRLKFNDDVLYGELLFTLLRENGIHIWDGFPCFLTEAYKEEDINQIIQTFKKCLNKMVSAGFFTTNKSESISSKTPNNSVVINKPPVNGAKLGRDKDGNPAWFIADSNKKGEYVKLDL